MRLSKKTVAYCLIGQTGYMAVIPEHLPLYWYKEKAMEEAKKGYERVAKVKVSLEVMEEYP